MSYTQSGTPDVGWRFPTDITSKALSRKKQEESQRKSEEKEMRRENSKKESRDPGFAACFCLGTVLGPIGLDTCVFGTSSGLGTPGSATR